MSTYFSTQTGTPSTLIDVLRWRAEHQPNQRAYTFVLDGETTEAHMTYGELDRQARAVGALLQRAGVVGERALLLYPPGLDYIAAFFGCLYAGVVAVPAYPPNPMRLERTLPRLRSIVQNARPAVALTTSSILPIATALGTLEPDFGALRWFATDNCDLKGAQSWQNPESGSDTLAFLQYTSGSTAAPKGVMLLHANLLHNSAMIQRSFGHTPESRGVIWLPPYHDMGLIGGILQPLYVGFPVTLMSPVDFLQRPLRWLQAISRERATTSGGPNFAYDLCVRKITPEQRATLDLSSWQVAFNGAEPIRPDTLERFAAAFASCGFRREVFYPCYGLAEATLIVSGGQLNAPAIVRSFVGSALERNRALTVETTDDSADARVLVGCGQSLPDQQIVVVDPETSIRCQPGRVGEIWMASPSVAQGYWRQPAETERTFHAMLADAGAGPFLRTGDLGFVQDGELFVTGRLKDLIIIRGRNHYPQDIELTVEQSHPALRPGCGAAFVVEVDGAERLVVVQEVERQERHIDTSVLAGAIRRAVADQHELHIYAVVLLKPGSIPKTSSGKIQRHACRAEFLAGSLNTLGSNILENVDATPDTAELNRDTLLASAPEQRQPLLESYLLAQVARVLQVAPSRVDPRQPMSSLGIDSLMAVELQHSIETSLGMVVPMVQFLQGFSIAELVAEALVQLSVSTATPAAMIAPAEATGPAHPLSYGQRALWFLHQLAPDGAAYNIASAVKIRSKLDVPAIRRVFQRLVERHPALRTTFTAAHGAPTQLIHEDVAVFFELEDASSWSEAHLDERLAAEAERPFDLERGPLLRVWLFERAAREHILLLVVHHSVADLWSLSVLMRELGALYAADRAGGVASLAALALRYTDYVYWQADLLAGPEGQRLGDYWRSQLAGPLPALDLPADRPRPPIQTYRGAAHSFTLDPHLTQRLQELAQASATTLYTTLLASFQVLLHRYSGQGIILVGSPTTGRGRAELGELVGYFVNPVVLRADLAGNPTFAAFLQQMRQTVLAALEHQAYPFPLLVEQIQPDRDPSRSPLFQAMFALQKAQGPDDADLAGFAVGDTSARVHLSELAIEPIALKQQVAQFDLTLTMAEVQGKLAASLQYNADLFDPATIARMAGQFQTLLRGIVADPEQPITQLPLLPPPERQLLLDEWNRTGVDYTQAICVHDLFESQTEATPDKVVAVYEQAAITFQELDTQAKRLANLIRSLQR